MQFEFQGHPQEVEKESLVERRFWKRSEEAWRDLGCVCVCSCLHLSSGVEGKVEDQVTQNNRGRRCRSGEMTRVMNHYVHYVMNGDSPITSAAYVWLLMAPVSMTICSATLRVNHRSLFSTDTQLGQPRSRWSQLQGLETLYTDQAHMHNKEYEYIKWLWPHLECGTPLPTLKVTPIPCFGL